MSDWSRMFAQRRRSTAKSRTMWRPLNISFKLHFSCVHFPVVLTFTVLQSVPIFRSAAKESIEESRREPLPLVLEAGKASWP
jgi:hypothetical protein